MRAEQADTDVGGGMHKLLLIHIQPDRGVIRIALKPNRWKFVRIDSKKTTRTATVGSSDEGHLQMKLGSWRSELCGTLPFLEVKGSPTGGVRCAIDQGCAVPAEERKPRAQAL